MDGDTSLAPGHPHLLAAAGALEVTVLPVFHPGAEGAEFMLDGPDNLEKPGVFCLTAVDVPGQHPKQHHQ